jgi:hypothetical protein
MLKWTKAKLLIAAVTLCSSSACSSPIQADDLIEKEGVAVGVTAGNLIVIPAKVISMSVGVLAGALSYVVTGGNADLTKQIWQDTTQGPYLVTPELAKKSVGDRPLLREKTGDMQPPREAQ